MHRSPAPLGALTLQVCQLLRDRVTPEPVRGQAVQFLNLLLTQVGGQMRQQELQQPASSNLTGDLALPHPPTHSCLPAP